MDPIFIVPLALAVAWAASRKKKKSSAKSTSTPTEPEVPSHDDGPGLSDGPNPTPEPWRPGGPTLPPPPTGPVGPKPFPGPSGGPKSPELGDPSPTEIHPGTTIEQIEAHENAAYGLFISSDCETVLEGERWWDDVFLPQARALVYEEPAAFHHPVAIIYELLVAPYEGEWEIETAAQLCIAAWEEFVYGDRTPLGTFSGWISDRSDPQGEYWDYLQWFAEQYPALSELLSDLYTRLWFEPDLAEVFEQEWPEDEPPGDIEFEPTGS